MVREEQQLVGESNQLKHVQMERLSKQEWQDLGNKNWKSRKGTNIDDVVLGKSFKILGNTFPS